MVQYAVRVLGIECVRYLDQSLYVVLRHYRESAVERIGIRRPYDLELHPENPCRGFEFLVLACSLEFARDGEDGNTLDAGKHLREQLQTLAAQLDAPGK